MLELPQEISTFEERLADLDRLARQWRCLYPKDSAMRLAQQSYDEDFLVRMAYNSNAIEGSTLTLADTEIIYEGEFVEGKPGREQIAARGIFEGAAYADELVINGIPLGEAQLRDLHERCALDLQPAARGMYRSAPAIIRASRTVPTSPAKVRDEVTNLFFRSTELRTGTHPLLIIPWFHACLENIHPFADGNGRTGRLWMNAQLRTCAYPPVSIKVDHSAEYKGSLEAWQVDGDATAFMDLFLDCLHEELEKRIAFLLQGAPDEGPYPFDVRRGEEMLGILYYQPASTASSLAQIMGLSSRQVQRILRELREGGFIEHVGSDRKGKWLLRSTSEIKW